MRVVRDTIENAELVPWEKGARGLAVSWRSGKQNAWPITGPIAWHRERIYVTPEDGRHLLALLNEDLAWRRAALYVEQPGGQVRLELPSVVFQWTDEDAPGIKDQRAPEPALA